MYLAETHSSLHTCKRVTILHCTSKGMSLPPSDLGEKNKEMGESRKKCRLTYCMIGVTQNQLAAHTCFLYQKKVRRWIPKVTFSTLTILASVCTVHIAVSVYGTSCLLEQQQLNCKSKPADGLLAHHAGSLTVVKKNNRRRSTGRLVSLLKWRKC